jgi:hypothetical protein
MNDSIAAAKSSRGAPTWRGRLLGRKPALCDGALDEPGGALRAWRLGPGAGALFMERANSQHGPWLDSLGALTGREEP